MALKGNYPVHVYERVYKYVRMCMCVSVYMLMCEYCLYVCSVCAMSVVCVCVL